MSFVEYERVIHGLYKADSWKGRKTEVPPRVEQAILDRLCSYEVGDGSMTNHLQPLPALRLLRYLAGKPLSLSPSLSLSLCLSLHSFLRPVLTGQFPLPLPLPLAHLTTLCVWSEMGIRWSDLSDHHSHAITTLILYLLEECKPSDQDRLDQSLSSAVSKKPYGDDGKTLSYHYCIMRVVEALRKMNATISLIEPEEGYASYDQ